MFIVCLFIATLLVSVILYTKKKPTGETITESKESKESIQDPVERVAELVVLLDLDIQEVPTKLCWKVPNNNSDGFVEYSNIESLRDYLEQRYTEYMNQKNLNAHIKARFE